MPNGRAWDSKNGRSTSMGKLLLALGGAFSEIETLIQTTNEELDINLTLNLIEEWEKSVGIPDKCFNIDGDIATRRLQVIAKLRNVRFQTARDWVELAAFFGVTVQVFPGVPDGFIATEKEKRFP